MSTDEIASSYFHQFKNGEHDLLAVIGPTASGKTGFAVSLAKKINDLAGRQVTEILSADSRQVYRGMDIGTGKDLHEYGKIPYCLVDIVEAGTKYNIFEYQRDFEREYARICRSGNVPILCGGSGLYVEAATCGYSLPEVPANPQLRAELEKKDTDTLIAMLASLKPLHNSTDYDTRKRLIRALEIAVHEAEHPVERSHYLPKKCRYVGIAVSREERISRIDKRLETRLSEGMVEEVRKLLERGIASEDLIYYGLEYKFVTLYLTGKMDYEEMKEKLGIAIHQFAKRQMTWFRGMQRRGIDIEWIELEK